MVVEHVTNVLHAAFKFVPLGFVHHPYEFRADVNFVQASVAVPELKLGSPICVIIVQSNWLSKDIFYCLLVFLGQIVEEAWRQFYEYYAVSWFWFDVAVTLLQAALRDVVRAAADRTPQSTFSPQHHRDHYGSRLSHQKGTTTDAEGPSQPRECDGLGLRFQDGKRHCGSNPDRSQGVSKPNLSCWAGRLFVSQSQKSPDIRSQSRESGAPHYAERACRTSDSTISAPRTRPGSVRAG
jgi:hypothetical protein